VSLQRTARVAGIVCALLVACTVILGAITKDPWPSNDGLTVMVLTVLAVIGLVIVRRQPRNAVGWLFVATAVVAVSDTLVREYLVLDYRQHAGRLAFGGLAVEWRGGMALTAFLIGFPATLLFPDGRVPSKRWRRLLWIYVVSAVIFSLAQFGGQATVQVGPHPAVDIRGGLPSYDVGWFAGGLWVLTPLFLLFWLASIGYQVLCWRRATGERRAQLKWLMSGSAVCVVAGVALVVAGDGSSLRSRLVGGVATLGVAALPIAVGIGILKYRLYEIDRLISRTLVYGSLTMVLAATYGGLVLGGEAIFSSFAGGSNLSIAVSTLVVAALFLPVRSRVQRFVDRRFYRRRYDAQRTLEGFGARLREQVDLETLSTELRGVVGETMQPTHVGLWLRTTGTAP
jgi:hypothetical protein